MECMVVCRPLKATSGYALPSVSTVLPELHFNDPLSTFGADTEEVIGVTFADHIHTTDHGSNVGLSSCRCVPTNRDEYYERPLCQRLDISLAN